MDDVQNLHNRVLLFPDKGTLFVCSDLHGNREDYVHMKGIFLDHLQKETDSYLLFLGDLIHGPEVARNERFTYTDESEFIIDDFVDLRKSHPGKVFSLLGNHEHGHVGGPHTSKFSTDEVASLERKLGKTKALEFRELFETFPLLAMTKTGVIFSHGAPSNSIHTLDDILHVTYSGHDLKSINDMYRVAVLDLLWNRCASDEVTLAFFNGIRREGYTPLVLIYGHDVVEEGFADEGGNRGILSTSFGVPERNKLYLKLDLAAKYNTIAELQDKKTLVPFWDFEDWHVEEGRYRFAEKAIQEGKYDTALFALQQEVEENYQRYFLLGRAFLLKSEKSRGECLETAIVCFERSLEILPSFAATHYLLGQAYEYKLISQKDAGVRTGECFLKALQHYRSAGTYDPKYEELGFEGRRRVREVIRM